MTNRNHRPRWIAAVLVALGLLALIAWWRWPDLHGKETQPTRMLTANASQPASLESGVMRTNSSRQAATKTADSYDEGDSAGRACNRDYKFATRDYRAQLDPAHTADEAIDRLLLDTLTAGPDDWISGTLMRGYQAARRSWPNDVELAWLAFDYCGASCDSDAEVRHLLAVDPDNAAAWMAAMRAARIDHDEAGFAHALQRAANAKIYDSRMGIVFLRSRPLLARVPVPESCRTPRSISELRQNVGRTPTDADRIDFMASSLEAAIATPSFSGLIQCIPKSVPLPDDERRQCNALLSRVAKGDTLIEQIIATRGLLALENDPARLAQLREQYRRLWWLQGQASAMPVPEGYATRMWSQGEVATLQGLATERNRWPPPPDWLPDDPRARALITGNPPSD
ncbi:MAG: hypothetical protein QM719_08125 [Thermomonas sp.]